MSDTAKAFGSCLSVAVVGLVLSTLLYAVVRDTSIGMQVFRGALFLASGAGPIVAYYVILRGKLRSASAEVGETAIDAVYYLGFLVTLVTLLATVISYAVRGKGDASSVNVVFIGISFGVSLFATAVALGARVDLMLRRDSLAATPEPTNVLRDRVFELEEAYRRLSGVMDEAITRFGDNVTKANSVLTERLAEAIRDARAQLGEAVDAASGELSKSQSSMREAGAAFAATMTSNNAALLKQMSDVIEQAREKLQDFVKNASVEAPSKALAAAVADVTATIAKAGKQVDEAFGSMAALEGRTTAAATTVGTLDAHLRRAGESAAAMSEALTKSSSRTAALDVDAIHASMAHLRESAERLSAATALAEQRYAAASDDAFGSITAKATALKTATELLSDAFVSTANEIARTAGVLAERVR